MYLLKDTEGPMLQNDNSQPNRFMQREKQRTLSKHAQRELDHKQQDTTSRGEPEDLGDKPFVERGGAFFAEDGDEGRVGPVVFGLDARNSGCTLNAGFHDL